MPSAPDTLISDVFDTSEFAPSERFEHWRARIAPALSMERPLEDIDVYYAKHESWSFGSFVFARETTTGGLFSRTDHLRRSGADHWCLLYMKAGSNFTTADHGISMRESTSHARPGDLGFYSLTQNCHGMMSKVSALTLFIPREGFVRQAHELDQLNNTLLSTPRARMLADYLQSLEKEISALTVADAGMVARATSAMIAACLSPSPDGLKEAEAPTLWLNRTRAGRYVLNNLEKPSLTPERICRDVGLSRSVLYRIFEPVGGVVQYIRRARLHAAHKLLTDDQVTRRIGEIATAVGFSDASDFSRAFNREFGYSPRHARTVAAHDAFEKRALDCQGSSLMSWLNRQVQQ